MSGKYNVNYWKGGKKNFSDEVFDKKKNNFFEKKEKNNMQKKNLIREFIFRINKIFDELSGNKNDPEILNQFDNNKWSDFL